MPRMPSGHDDDVVRGATALAAAKRTGLGLGPGLGQGQGEAAYDTVCFAGGSADCVGLAAGWEDLCRRRTHVLGNVTHFIGASGGALVALLAFCGFDWQTKPVARVLAAFQDLLRSRASSKECLLLLRALLHAKFQSGDVTLAQLHAGCGGTLTVAATHAETGEPVFLTHDTFPHMPAAAACMTSLFVPGVFRVQQAARTDMSPVPGSRSTAQISLSQDACGAVPLTSACFSDTTPLSAVRPGARVLLVRTGSDSAAWTCTSSCAYTSSCTSPCAASTAACSSDRALALALRRIAHLNTDRHAAVAHDVAVVSGSAPRTAAPAQDCTATPAQSQGGAPAPAQGGAPAQGRGGAPAPAQGGARAQGRGGARAQGQGPALCRARAVGPGRASTVALAAAWSGARPGALSGPRAGALSGARAGGDVRATTDRHAPPSMFRFVCEMPESERTVLRAFTALDPRFDAWRRAEARRERAEARRERAEAHKGHAEAHKGRAEAHKGHAEVHNGRAEARRRHAGAHRGRVEAQSNPDSQDDSNDDDDRRDDDGQDDGRDDDSQDDSSRYSTSRNYNRHEYARPSDSDSDSGMSCADSGVSVEGSLGKSLGKSLDKSRAFHKSRDRSARRGAPADPTSPGALIDAVTADACALYARGSRV